MKRPSQENNCTSDEAPPHSARKRSAHPMTHSIGDEVSRMNTENRKEQEIDEGLYSRMLYVIGTEGLKKMASSSVVIYNLDGLGAEIAKNLVLGGISQVLLCDEKPASPKDLFSQFFVQANDFGRNRAEVTKEKVSELNGYVKVLSLPTCPSAELLKPYDVLVVSNCLPAQELDLASLCRRNNKKFVSAKSCGLSCAIFCDFGEEFVVLDPSAATPTTNIVSNITNDTEGVVTVLDEQRHGYEDNSYVSFSEVKGMTELNNLGPFKVKYLGPYTFSIGDTSKFGRFEGTAQVTEVFLPKKMQFKDLQSARLAPEFIEYDFAKFDYPRQLHLAYMALGQFYKAHERMPKPYDQSDAEEFVSMAGNLNDAHNFVEKVNADLLEKFAKTCQGDLAPINAFIGGIASQEVMKACTRKFIPIKQFFYFEAYECLPAELPTSPFPLEESRYDGEIVIFGPALVERMKSTRSFLVGVGALGCEFLKCFALMGIGCGPNGLVTTTDMDTIGKSNLNRQFLFRPWDIGKLKTNVAAEAARRLNTELNIVAHNNKVGAETESLYDDTFFEGLDFVVNALDNVAARTYMDLRCVYYRKPLLESGTLGTRANCQVVVPYMTESYSSTQDPPEKSIPMCTLKNFPNAIEHTIQWARDYFEELFTNKARTAIEYMENPEGFIKQAQQDFSPATLEKISMIRDVLCEPIRSFEDCVRKSRQIFEDSFTNQIKQLLFNFPPDLETSKGVPFWSGPKRCPQPLTFDPVRCSSHGDFVFATANLLAAMHNIEQNPVRHVVVDMASKVKVKPFQPKTGVKIATSDADAAANVPSICKKDEELAVRALPKPDMLKGIKIVPLEFEKDDDTNYHMDFVASASNLRAENYGISPADRLKTKLIAGKIIPAIATTTSAIVGLVCIELLKIIQGKDRIEDYRNGYFDLADCSFVFSEPVPAKKMKYRDVEYTLWDRIDVQGDMTLQQFIDYFKDQYKMKVTMISHGVMMLYAFFMAKPKVQERMNMKISEIIESVQKRPLEPHIRALVLELTVHDADTDEDFDIPYIRYILAPGTR